MQSLCICHITFIGIIKAISMQNIQISNQKFDDGFIESISARDLHEWLECKQDFSTWIKRRIKQCNFVSGLDYVSLHQSVERHIGATSRIEYFISKDMAKHLCMMEKTKRGHETRIYFIEQEKIARSMQDGLLQQFTQALIEYEKFSDLASQAGRTLSVVGKKLKPQSLEKVEKLKEKLQPNLFIE